MNTLDETATLAIPTGSWQLEIEPVANEPEPPLVDSEEKRPTPKVVEQAPVASPPPVNRILEALLFAAREPLTSEQLCQVIRGLTPTQLDDSIRSINLQYRRQGRPYVIASQTTGYRLILRLPYRLHLESLYGGVKEARFSQVAIESLAIIAYRQPITQTQLEAILGQEAGSPLRQLIRRGMIQVHGADEKKQACYITTARFLEYFSLNKIEDLPLADDLERL
jgi:segregation and condensation protein B